MSIRIKTYDDICVSITNDSPRIVTVIDDAVNRVSFTKHELDAYMAYDRTAPISIEVWIISAYLCSIGWDQKHDMTIFNLMFACNTHNLKYYLDNRDRLYNLYIDAHFWNSFKNDGDFSQIAQHNDIVVVSNEQIGDFIIDMFTRILTGPSVTTDDIMGRIRVGAYLSLQVWSYGFMDHLSEDQQNKIHYIVEEYQYSDATFAISFEDYMNGVEGNDSDLSWMNANYDYINGPDNPFSSYDE